MKKTTRTTQQPTEEQARQLGALDAIRDEDIDLSDIPEQGGKMGWVRGTMYRPVMKAISIRLPAPDLALARQLPARKWARARLGGITDAPELVGAVQV